MLHGADLQYAGPDTQPAVDRSTHTAFSAEVSAVLTSTSAGSRQVSVSSTMSSIGDACLHDRADESAASTSSGSSSSSRPDPKKGFQSVQFIGAHLGLGAPGARGSTSNVGGAWPAWPREGGKEAGEEEKELKLQLRPCPHCGFVVRSAEGGIVLSNALTCTRVCRVSRTPAHYHGHV